MQGGIYILIQVRSNLQDRESLTFDQQITRSKIWQSRTDLSCIDAHRSSFHSTSEIFAAILSPTHIMQNYTVPCFKILQLLFVATLMFRVVIPRILVAQLPNVTVPTWLVVSKGRSLWHRAEASATKASLLSGKNDSLKPRCFNVSSNPQPLSLGASSRSVGEARPFETTTFLALRSRRAHLGELRTQVPSWRYAAYSVPVV